MKKKIAKILVKYDKRYTVASLSILTDQILQLFNEAIPEEKSHKNQLGEEMGISRFEEGYNQCIKDIKKNIL